MKNAVDPEGLLHVGVIYESTDEFVAMVTPHLEDALQHGRAVTMMVDAGTARRVHDALGPAADGITFPNPLTMFRRGPQAYLDHLRNWAHRDRRTLVVGQYSALDPGQRACALAEDGINLVLPDLSITLLCACSRGLGPSMEGTARRTHPKLITAGTRGPNSDYRPPADSTPVTSRLWGPLALRSRFRDTADCHRIRSQIARIAAQVGLQGDDAKAAILAVHEVAVLALQARRVGAGNDPGPGRDDPLLEVRVSARAMLSEVWQSRATSQSNHPPAPAETRGSRTDPVCHIRPFCHYVDIQDTVHTRVTRVMTHLDRSPSCRTAEPT